MSELSNIYDPNTFIKEVRDNRYIQIQDVYGEVDFTIDYLYFSSAIPNGRFLTVIKTDETSIKLQFTSSSKTITGLNKLLDLIGKLKKGTYNPTPTTSTTETQVLDYSTMYSSSNFIKEIAQVKYIQIQDRLASEVVHSIDFSNVTTTLTQGRFVFIYQTNVDLITLQFISNSEAITAHNILRETIDQLKDGTYDKVSSTTIHEPTPLDYSTMYSSSNFIKEVFQDRYIQIQDRLASEVVHSIDYNIVTSTLLQGRFVIVQQTNMDSISLQFISNSEAIAAQNLLRETIDQLKDDTYSKTISGATTDTISLDYSSMYHSSNFIKEVFQNQYIQIQDRLADQVVHSIDFNNITTTLTQGRFVFIYQTNVDLITLQFISNSESITAHTILRETIDQLKDNTYNKTSTIIGGVLYDPNTFINQIEFEDYSVQLSDIKGNITDSIVARQVTTVFTSENFVKVKFEASDELKSYQFETSSKAIEGAEKLRIAIKTITDKLSSEGDGSGVQSYSEDFNSNIWKLDPPVDFSMSSFNLDYYELVCPDGSNTCADADIVKQRCRGLVEIIGNEDTDVLSYINIYFNQTVKGRAILIG